MAAVQLTLFGPPVRPKRWIESQRPALGTAETSRAAAASMEGEPLAQQLGEVWEALLRCGETGATRQDLVELTGIPEKSITARVNKLVEIGRAVEPVGVTRPTSSGRPAKVVVAVRR